MLVFENFRIKEISTVAPLHLYIQNGSVTEFDKHPYFEDELDQGMWSLNKTRPHYHIRARPSISYLILGGFYNKSSTENLLCNTTVVKAMILLVRCQLAIQIVRSNLLIHLRNTKEQSSIN